MNVLIMSKIFAKSGVGSHIMDLSEILMERGNTVSIMSGTNNHENFCKEKNIPFVHVDICSIESFQMKKLHI